MDLVVTLQKYLIKVASVLPLAVVITDVGRVHV